MFGSSKTQSLSNESVVFSFLKGLILAALASLALIVLFAFCLKWFSLPDTVIVPANLVIKGLSVLLGSSVAVKGESKGLVKGFSFGLCYVVLAFVMFSALAGTFSIGVSFVLDIAFSGLLGGIVGIVKVNKK